MRSVAATRKWLLALAVPFAALGSGIATASTASTAPAVRPVSLPRDHGAHPAFGIEWWYTAGTLAGTNRHDYFWFATIWSAGGEAIAKVNVVDLRTDRIVLSHEYLRSGAYRAGLTRLGVGSFRLGWRAHGRWGTWAVSAPTNRTSRLELKLSPVQPYVLNGRHGIIRQGSGGRSAYYSAPRLKASGTLATNGRRVRLSGQGWLDHQWGNFGTDVGALRWNWFACQFQNGSDLMLYQFLNPSNRPSGVQNGTFVHSNGKFAHLSRFTVTPLRPVIKPAGARSTYPLRWRINVPSAGIELTVRARARNQFIVNRYVPSFWEGAAAVTNGRPGGCIVESSREAS